TGNTLTETSTVSLPIQPFALVTVTLYVPAVVTANVCAVELSDQRNVAPVFCAFNVTVFPAQITVSAPKFTTGRTFSVITIVSFSIQPLLKVTTTEYVPAVSATNVWLDEPSDQV